MLSHRTGAALSLPNQELGSQHQGIDKTPDDECPGRSVPQPTEGEDRVENLYGSDNLVSTEIDAGEGMTMPGYVLFPGTTDELVIELGEDKQPQRARFSNPRSGWKHGTTGLTIGSTLHELVEMNGAPFEFLGFGWDYGGTVSDWQGGGTGQPDRAADLYPGAVTLRRPAG